MRRVEIKVCLASDHGNCLGIHGHTAKNVHHEESLIVPFLIRWPGKIGARRDDLLLSVPDIYPTLLDLLGMDADVPEAVDGVSYADLFLSGEGARPTSALYGRAIYNRPDMGERGVRTDRYTLMLDQESGKPMRIVLHDNQADPHQLKNIAGQNLDVVDTLIRDELLPWLRKAGDPWRPAEA